MVPTVLDAHPVWLMPRRSFETSGHGPAKGESGAMAGAAAGRRGGDRRSRGMLDINAVAVSYRCDRCLRRH